jgi:hypothetical protein
MTPSDYWYAINSMYLPTCSHEFMGRIESVHEAFNKVIEKIVLSKTILRKKSNPVSKRSLMIDLASSIGEEYVLELNEGEESRYELDPSFSKGSSIDNMISNMNKMLGEVSERNKSLFKGKSTNRYDPPTELFKYDPDDVLTDLRVRSDTINKFKDYIIRKHIEKAESNDKVFTSRIEEEINCNPDDIVCLVCSDGDYEDDDLIVYCSLCQMTVHQRCYGIIEIPQEDWICDACVAFGAEKSKEVECILCPVIGGAMKPCSVKLSTTFYCAIMNLRKKIKMENLINYEYDRSGSGEQRIGNSDIFLSEAMDVKMGSNIVKIDLDDELMDNGLSSSKILTENYQEDEKLTICKQQTVCLKECEEIGSDDVKMEEQVVADIIEHAVADKIEVQGTDLIISELNNNIAVESSAKIVKMDVDEECHVESTVGIKNIYMSTEDVGRLLEPRTSSEQKIRKNLFKLEVAPFNTDNVSGVDTNKHTIVSSNSKAKGRRKKDKKKEDQTSPPKKEVNVAPVLLKQAKENAWVHLSCACWIPEVEINNYEKKEDIRSKL